MYQPNVLSTFQLEEKIQNGKSEIIDLRTADAYNGWPLPGEKRGGHIPRARSLPFKWSKYMDWIEIVRNKNIAKDKEIVLYGVSREELVNVAGLFQKAGYRDIYIYELFSSEWLKDESRRLDTLERYRQLVPASWVKRVIDGDLPEDHTGGKTVICHAHYRNRDAYLSGHLPGAIDIDTLALESPETWNRREPAELEKNLLEHGITAETTVVLYGKFMWPDNNDEFPGSAAGHIGAIRCAMIMMYAGVKDVRVMNGGFQSWKDAGYPISKKDERKIPETEFGVVIPARPELIVDIDQAKEILAAENAELVSVRSWPEYIGEVSGYNYIEKKGRIPGSVFGNCGSDAYHMENYRNRDHTTREYGEIEKIWRESGVTPDKFLAFYCGTGWRGSEAFFNAWLMGWPGVAVFDGGWFEWSNDPENPFETGVPEGFL